MRGIEDQFGAGDNFGGRLDAVAKMPPQMVMVRGLWRMEHYRPAPFIKGIRRKIVLLDVQEFGNIVVNTGLDELLDVGLSHAATTANWYLGLKDTGVPVAADTMAAHASWATISPYSNATDPEWIDAGVSAQSVDNSASVAVFNINATDTIFGAFLKDNNTKGGATGLLYAVADFAASRAVLNGDTLNVTATFTTAAV